MAEKREPSLNFRVTPTEERQFRDAADALDMSLSSFIRKSVKLGSALLMQCPELRAIELEYVPGAKKVSNIFVLLGYL